MDGMGGRVNIRNSVAPSFYDPRRDKKIIYNKRGGTFGKAVVLGILDRERKEVRAKVVVNTKRDTLQPQVFSNVKLGSTVYTDDAIAYDGLNYKFVHDVINDTEKYVRGRVHTNGISYPISQA